MKKRKFKIWLGLLLALFLGSLGSLDQVWCFKATGCRDIQKAPCDPPDAPESQHQCAGCSDSPVVLGAFRAGHFRFHGASLGNSHAAHSNSLCDAFLSTGGYSGDLFARLSITVLRSFSFLRTVVLLIWASPSPHFFIQGSKSSTRIDCWTQFHEKPAIPRQTVACSLLFYLSRPIGLNNRIKEKVLPRHP